jgi:hypothetical protein
MGFLLSLKFTKNKNTACDPMFIQWPVIVAFFWCPVDVRPLAGISNSKLGMQEVKLWNFRDVKPISEMDWVQGLHACDENLLI